MRTPIIAGNWKMNKGPAEATALAQALRSALAGARGVDLMVAPTYVSLPAVHAVLQGSNIALGAQELFWEDHGAYTGAIPAPMLVEVGCTYVLVGHSERRQVFDETDDGVNRKLRAALSHGLTPVLCIGETLAEREEGRTNDRVEIQLRGGVAGIGAGDMKKVVLAYEPVWAIGTGRTASDEQAQEVHAFIRGVLRSRFDDDVAQSVRIQYGGSVKPANAAGLLSQPDIDGALVGGASLSAASFAGIVTAALGR